MHALPEAERKPYFAYIAVKAPHIQDGASVLWAKPSE